MQCTNIPLVNTGQIHKLSLDYIRDNPDTRKLYNYKPSLPGIEKAMQDRKNFPVNRQLLSDNLKKQYRQMNPDFFEDAGNKKVLDNIDLLQNDNTFTITTGHQLNIFTGPLYFIYKIISAIKYTENLKLAFPSFDFVPVYWMASEDHDFEEINHINVWGEKITWNTQVSGPVGRLDPSPLKDCIEELAKVLERDKKGPELLQLFRDAYLNHKTLAGATRYLVNALFKDEGLVIIDGDDPGFKKVLVPVLEHDIFNNSVFNVLQETLEALGKNYKLPVSPREINVFYLNENSRKRVVFENGTFKEWEGNKSWTENELRDEINQHPENFSPNVVLRGMYQELILPNLAYIGGNNEIAYWLELREAFQQENVFFPQLLVRDSALIVGKKAAKDIQALKLEVADFFLKFEDLKFKFYQSNELDHPAEKDAEEIIVLYDRIRRNVQGLPADLVANIVKQLNPQSREVRRWKNDIHNKQLELQEKNISKLEKLYNNFFPEGEFQERHDNFIPYYLKYGKEWFKMLKSACNPLLAACHVFVEE
jgi:bacillithiol synthase